MPEVGAPAVADGERRALFRMSAPGAGGHHYATLREHAGGPVRYTLEVRRGLVWSFTERVLVVKAEARGGGGLALSVAGASGPDESAGSVRGDDLAAFAPEALRVAAARLGVAAEAFDAASHVDLGESGTLGVDAPVRQRSSELLALVKGDRPGAEEAPPGSASGAPVSPGALTRHMDAATGRPPEATAARARSERGGSGAPAVAGREPASAGEGSAPAGTAAAGQPRAREEGPNAARPNGLLGRIVGWLRRAARAALGR